MGVQQTFADGKTTCSPFSCCWQQNLGAALHQRQGLILDYIGPKLTCFHDLGVFKEAVDRWLWLSQRDDFWKVAIGPVFQVELLWSSCLAQLDSLGCRWTNVSFLFKGDVCRKTTYLYYDFFFGTMLRASLQLWQSLGCASIVIVRQRDQKERSGTKKNKANKTPKTTTKTHNPSLTNRVKGETRWDKLRLSRQTTIPDSHNVFSRK